MKIDFHTPVLSHEAIDFLINENLSNHVIVDGTLGSGGYTKLICKKISDSGKVISIDKDLHAIEYAGEFLQGECSNVKFVNGNFGDLKFLLDEIGITKITGLVLDLGLSSYQLEFEEGFSFMKDTALDMRAYKKDDLTAAMILNSFSKNELTEIFETYGEIGNAERLAGAIFKKRKVKKFYTTFDIVDLLKEEYDINKKNLVDFLAKIFQALRIKINNELENLERVLKDSVELIMPGGRIVVVSYHSLEDRIVKNFFREESSKYSNSDNSFFKEEKKPLLKTLTKKPVAPTREEVKSNSRSRSAKLRAAEVI